MRLEHDPHRPDDETLVAYADGRLDDERTAQISRYLEGDAEARRTVELLRQSAELAKAAMDEALHTTPSPALVNMILQGGDATSSSGTVVPFVRRLPFKRLVFSNGSAIGLAASIALVVGCFAGYLGARRTVPGPAAVELAVGPLDRESTLSKLLETKPSGDRLALPAIAGHPPREVMIMATFRDKTERPCREFEVHPVSDGETSGVSLAVACRRATGEWVVEGASRLVNAEHTTTQDFSPASGQSAGTNSGQSDAIDGILRMLGAHPSLKPDQEQALLSSGWRN